jgi:acetyltransferase-like isoleucine patch superfamily enzyme
MSTRPSQYFLNISDLIKKISQIMYRTWFGCHGIVCDGTLRVRGLPYISNHGKVTIGKNFRLNSGIRSNPIGGDNRVIIAVHKNASLLIGDNVGISNCTIFSSLSIEIGDNVNIGGSVKIYDTDFHSISLQDRLTVPEIKPRPEAVRICNGVWIGFGVVILKGVKIGAGSVVGANSVVTRSIPENQLWAGNPARFVKELNSEF